MNRRALLVALAAALLALVVRTPRADAAEAPLTILAAASLTEALQKVGAAWAAKGHAAPVFSFDASSRLAKQVEAGAPADLFFSADRDWMDYLDRKGLVDAPTRRDLLGNTLVAVVGAKSRRVLGQAGDLQRPDIARVGLAGESVPAGRYARTALQALGAWPGVEAKVVNGDNVRTVLGWVARGEVDVGVVYATDAKVEPGVKVAFVFPATSHAPIVYPAAVVAGAPHAREAKDFLAFCRSPEATAIFGAAGFSTPTAAR